MERLGLMRVELLDAAGRQRAAQPVVGLFRERRERCGYGRQAVSGRDDGVGLPPSGARDSVNRVRASWRDRSLSPLMTGRVWEAMGKVLQ